MLTALVTLNTLSSVIANAAFEISARSATFRDVLTWQLLGNLAGLVTVVTLTGLLRYVPLSVAFPLTTGASILGVQVVAATWLFHEPMNAARWTGSPLIGVGVLLVQR
jgi:multidrug transporter EmrE-like cation transporter